MLTLLCDNNTKTKAITALVPAEAPPAKALPAKTPLAKAPPAKTVAPKSESSSSNGNTFREIDINNPPKTKPPFYVYVPFMAYLNKVIEVGKSSETGGVEYTIEKYRTESWKIHRLIIRNMLY